MDDEHTSEPQADDSPGSVFGNLPGSRPGRRSPRRSGSAPATPKATPKAKSPKAPPKPPSAPAEPRAEREPESEAPERSGGLEDVAWAGVAAAAEAATLGVRLVGRAVEALRGNSQERD